MTSLYQLSPIDHLLSTVANSLDAHTSALFLTHPGNRLRLVSFHSLSNKVKKAAIIKKGQGPVGWVMREQRPVNICRFTKGARNIGIYGDDVDIKSLIAVPLPSELGVLMADSKTRLKFTDKHLNILISFGQCAVHLLQAARLKAENSLLRRLLLWDPQGPNEFENAVRELMATLSMENCILLRRVHDKGFFRIATIFGQVSKEYTSTVMGKRFSLDSGVGGWIFRHSKDILLRRFGSDPDRSFLIERGEEIEPKSTVLGLYFPSDKTQVFEVEHVVIFAGSGDPGYWPKELPEAVKKRIERVAPWR